MKVFLLNTRLMFPFFRLPHAPTSNSRNIISTPSLSKITTTHMKVPRLRHLLASTSHPPRWPSLFRHPSLHRLSLSRSLRCGFGFSIEWGDRCFGRLYPGGGAVLHHHGVHCCPRRCRDPSGHPYRYPHGRSTIATHSLRTPILSPTLIRRVIGFGATVLWCC